jgi:hypothetical protein
VNSSTLSKPRLAARGAPGIICFDTRKPRGEQFLNNITAAEFADMIRRDGRRYVTCFWPPDNSGKRFYLANSITGLVSDALRCTGHAERFKTWRGKVYGSWTKLVLALDPRAAAAVQFALSERSSLIEEAV